MIKILIDDDDDNTRTTELSKQIIIKIEAKITIRCNIGSCK